MRDRGGDEFIEQALRQQRSEPVYRSPSVTRPPTFHAPVREVGGYFASWVMLFLGMWVGRGVSVFLLRAVSVIVILIIFALAGLYQAISQWIWGVQGVTG